MEDLERRALLGVAGIGAMAAFSAAARGGPLNPPAGSVASTSKPLGELEPRIAINAANTPGNGTSTFRITQPGSYYLAGNLTGEPGKHGILIEVSNVTVDLNGFTLTGVGGSLSGIANQSNTSYIRITNGIVRDFDAYGILLNANECSIDRVQAISNGTSGLHMGIAVGSNSILTECIAVSNAGAGLSGNLACTFDRCTAASNGGAGIVSSSATSAINCIARTNALVGFSVGMGSLVRSCLSLGDTGGGISANNQVRIEGCTIVNFTGIGIDALNYCEVRDNTVSGLSVGVSTGAIQVAGNGLVRENFCQRTGFGIQATAADNTITANQLANHTTAYVLAAGNHYGPFSVTASNGAAVSGSAAAPGTMGSSDPHANYIN